MLPGYTGSGGTDGRDPVEAAIANSQLEKWRQAALVADYQRYLHEQASERNQR